MEGFNWAYHIQVAICTLIAYVIIKGIILLLKSHKNNMIKPGVISADVGDGNGDRILSLTFSRGGIVGQHVNMMHYDERGPMSASQVLIDMARNHGIAARAAVRSVAMPHIRMLSDEDMKALIEAICRLGDEDKKPSAKTLAWEERWAKR